MPDLPISPPGPTGPQCRVLRRMAGTCLVATTVGPNRVLCRIDGHEVPKQAVAGLLARGLILATVSTDDTTTYQLTAEGRRWAANPIGG